MGDGAGYRVFRSGQARAGYRPLSGAWHRWRGLGRAPAEGGRVCPLGKRETNTGCDSRRGRCLADRSAAPRPAWGPGGHPGTRYLSDRPGRLFVAFPEGTLCVRKTYPHRRYLPAHRRDQRCLAAFHGFSYRPHNTLDRHSAESRRGPESNLHSR